MADVFFKCGSCGKHLVVADAGIGCTVPCPDCETALVIPKVLLIQQCPHCQAAIKSAAEMKGELVNCPACQKEFHLAGTVEEAGGLRTLAYHCPACHAEVEMPEQLPDQTSPCPSCGATVHFRRKLHLKPPTALSLVPAPNRWRYLLALAILVIFGGLVVSVFLKIHGALR